MRRQRKKKKIQNKKKKQTIVNLYPIKRHKIYGVKHILLMVSFFTILYFFFLLLFPFLFNIPKKETLDAARKFMCVFLNTHTQKKYIKIRKTFSTHFPLMCFYIFTSFFGCENELGRKYLNICKTFVKIENTWSLVLQPIA